MQFSHAAAAAAAASQAKGGHVPGERRLIVFIPQYFLSVRLIVEPLFVLKNVKTERFLMSFKPELFFFNIYIYIIIICFITNWLLEETETG